MDTTMHHVHSRSDRRGTYRVPSVGVPVESIRNDWDLHRRIHDIVVSRRRPYHSESRLWPVMIEIAPSRPLQGRGAGLSGICNGQGRERAHDFMGGKQIHGGEVNMNEGVLAELQKTREYKDSVAGYKTHLSLVMPIEDDLRQVSQTSAPAHGSCA